MNDRRRDARARAAVDRLEEYHRRYPGGMSLTEPFEGVRLGFMQQLVAACYADGLSVAAIAAAIGCAASTARTHLDQIAGRVGGKGPRRARIAGWVHRRRLAAQVGALAPEYAERRIAPEPAAADSASNATLPLARARA